MIRTEKSNVKNQPAKSLTHLLVENQSKVKFSITLKDKDEIVCILSFCYFISIKMQTKEDGFICAINPLKNFSHIVEFDLLSSESTPSYQKN